MTKFLPLAALLTTACYEKAPPAGVGLRGDVSLPGLNTKDDDGDQFSEADGDCDDTDPTVYPGAAELCDKIDNDCDGEVDTNIDAAIGTRVYPDGDGDGFGLEDDAFYACDYVLANPAEAGIATNGLDCDDSDRFINPAASELCDDIDNDCDGSVDDDPINGEPMYTDGDNDGFGDGAVQGTFCEEEGPPAGYSATSTDCNDADDQVYPGNIEVCDGIDNDCDGDADSNAVDQVIFYPDTDADGFGDAAGPTVGPACSVPGMWVDNADDCDDGSADINPDAEEVCDTIDNDCNGAIDEALTTTYYTDADGDGHGDPEAPTAQCADPGTGFALSPDDCDDTDATISPSATEGVGDDIDADCDGSELCFADEDSDGYTADSPAVVTSVDAFCSGPGEALATAPAGDCDDTDAALGSVTMDGDCDGILTAEDCDDGDEFAVAIADDGDCDGVLTDDDCDDADAIYGAISADADCDGVLTDDDCDDEDAASTVVDDDNDCDGFITTEDCDDDNDAINPDAYDVLDDGLDNNCDGGDWVTCDDDFIIGGSDPTINIAALEFCGAVTGLVYLYHTELTDTSGLSRLRTVGGLEILENAAMTSISLPSLTSVGDNFFISDNALLSSITLASLETIGGNLNVMSNDALTSIDTGLLSTVGQDFVIGENPMLTGLTADSLSSIGDDMWIAFNDALTGFSTSAVTTIGNRLEIQWNSSLEAFDLGALEAVGHFATINGNDSLAAIALNNLTDAESYLEISDNAVLSALELDALVTAPEIDIVLNSSLCQSVPDTLETELLARGWSGLFTSLDNLDGC